MTTYAYAVRDRGGKMINGTLEADTTATVASKLKSMGYAPISISEANAGMQKEIKIPGLRGFQGQAQGPRRHVAAVRHDDQ